MTALFIREKRVRFEAQRPREKEATKIHVKTEAETGIMLAEAENYLGLISCKMQGKLFPVQMSEGEGPPTP